MGSVSQKFVQNSKNLHLFFRTNALALERDKELVKTLKVTLVRRRMTRLRFHNVTCCTHLPAQIVRTMRQ